MAAGTEVCHFSSSPSQPTNFSTIPESLATLTTSTSNYRPVKSFTQNQPWRTLTSLLTRNHTTILAQKPENRNSVFSFANRYMYSSCVFGKLNCVHPQQTILRSQSTVRLHLNRLLFGSIQPPFYPFLVNSKTEGNQMPSAEETDTPQVGRSKDFSSACQGIAKFHPCEGEVTSQEAVSWCNEYRDNGTSDSEDSRDEYGYDSDDEDDFILFSDADTPVSDPEQEHNTLAVHKLSNYVTLCSQESGFCDESDLPSSFEDWSDCDSSDENDMKPACVGVNELLWNSFEVQALSPQICSKRTSCISPPTHDCKQTLVNTDVATPNPETPQKCPRNALSVASANQSANNSSECDDIGHRASPRHAKRVSFKVDSELTVVHHIIAWDYAYRAARKGPWEQYARDRQHFSRRIESVACILEPCLAKRLGAG